MITITAVKVILQASGALQGYATVTIDGAFVVRGIKIIKAKSGRILTAMPSKKRPDGTYQDIAHPISSEARLHLEQAIVKEYDRVMRASTPVGDGNEEGFTSTPKD